MDIIFGLLAALSFGIADFFARFATHRLGIIRTLFYMQFVGLLVLTFLLLPNNQFARLATAGPEPLLWGLLTALACIIGYLCLYAAFAVGKLSVVAPIGSSYAAVTVILSVISGEKLSLLQILGILIVLFGVILAAQQKDPPASSLPSDAHDQSPATRFRLPPGVLWALLAALSLGLTFWLLGFKLTPTLGDTLPIWLFRLLGSFVAASLAVKTRTSITFPRGWSLALALGIGLLDMAALIFSNLGFATGSVAVVSVLSSLYSAVAVLLAWIFLKERLRLIQWLGILLLLLGIVLTHA